MSAKIAVSLVDHLRDRMHAAELGRRLARRQRDVDAFAVEARIERGGAERVLARGDRLRDAVLQPVDRRALLLALVRRHRAERLEQRRDRAALAERGDAHGFERGFVAGLVDGAEQFCSSFAMSVMAQHSVMRGLVPRIPLRWHVPA